MGWRTNGGALERTNVRHTHACPKSLMTAISWDRCAGNIEGWYQIVSNTVPDPGGVKETEYIMWDLMYRHNTRRVLPATKPGHKAPQPPPNGTADHGW